ncbi:hypothetical protein FB567DRAFT_634520 [Paraphoma chrysanthemicola]|uniref:NADH:flavin oxidoreductase/NADH oxidase N-terminal domain-containing protein n=1 Tax=Paraphoma chrysanthemicola TaxID=798071 RepID=A0A8K0VSC2_9PLEO|nr:hypothetical protein FB567DRAFT_634520 [Paraphoma chrysanthemicola]
MSNTMSESRLFKPLKLGTMELKNRVAMAPCTRFRASDDAAILPMAKAYYGERACVPGTLLIAEGAFISKHHGGYPNIPGIYNQEHIDAWKIITDEVHDKGSFIYLQIWALGRAADSSYAQANNITVKSSSAVPIHDDDAVPVETAHAVPVEMTHDDIKEAIATYAQAAKNAIAAGFDGVEIHAANGYLVDQFTQDTCNKRTDKYGGSIENRSRFAIEVTRAVVDAVGAERTGIRLSPFSEFQGMKMKTDLIPQFSDLLRKLNTFKLAFVHLVEPRIGGDSDVQAVDSLEPLLPLYNSGPIVLAGGFKPDSAKRLLDEEHRDRDVVVAFGRYFISTPDLVFRLERGIEFNPYKRATFYEEKKSEVGYNDYPFSKEWKREQANP